MMSLKSPIPPSPKPTTWQKFRKGFSAAGLVLLIMIGWAGSSLFIAPVVQYGIDSMESWLRSSTAKKVHAEFGGRRFEFSCDAFESLPAGCDGSFTTTPEEPAVYGPRSIFNFWGAWPDLRGLTNIERTRVTREFFLSEGASYVLQRRWGTPPVGEEALALARAEMNTAGGTVERRDASGVILISPGEGSLVGDNYYAIYTRDDGLLIPAACFGSVCRVVQAPWQDDLVYGFTLPAARFADLPALDALVRRKLQEFIRQ